MPAERPAAHSSQLGDLPADELGDVEGRAGNWRHVAVVDFTAPSMSTHMSNTYEKVLHMMRLQLHLSVV